jgi:hypothetical protein
MLRRYINKWKHSLHAKTFYAIKSNPRLFFNTLIFDFLFLVLLYYINTLVKSSLPTEESLIANIEFTVLFFLFTIIYLLLLIFIYSFLKYCILDFVKMLVDLSWKFRKIIREKKFELNRFFKFCFLNLIIFVSSFITFIILNAIYLFSVKQEYLKIIFLLTMIPLFLFIYAYLNITHSLFTLGFNLKETIKKGLVLLKRIRAYYCIFIFSILLISVYSLIYFIINLIITSFTSVNILIYNQIFTVITAIVFYFIIAFNRVYFYLVVDIIKEE